MTRRHFHSFLNAVDTITASSPRSSTSSSDEFWSCCSLTSSFGIIGFPSSPRPPQTTDKGPTETQHHPEKAPNSPQMYRPRQGGISHYGGTAGSLYGAGPSGSVYGNGSKGHGRNKEERTLSVTFTRGDGDKVVHRRTPSVYCRYSSPCSVGVQHCNGIQALRIHSGNLYSASRDSTIKRWGLRDDHHPVLRGSFEGHCDWVNDITFVEQYLASASSDGTVKLWRPEKRTCILTLKDHIDYVSCLASAPGHSILTSAGLRSEIFLYDLEVGDTPPVTDEAHHCACLA